MDAKGIKRLILIAAPGIYDELPEAFNEWNRLIPLASIALTIVSA
jgi:hypothetical protein